VVLEREDGPAVGAGKCPRSRAQWHSIIMHDGMVLPGKFDVVAGVLWTMPAGRTPPGNFGKDRAEDLCGISTAMAVEPKLPP